MKTNLAMLKIFILKRLKIILSNFNIKRFYNKIFNINNNRRNEMIVKEVAFGNLNEAFH